MERVSHMVIHLIHYPVNAKKLVEPLVKMLVSGGIDAELWIEPREDVAQFFSAIDCPKRTERFDLSVNPFRVLARVLRLWKRFLELKPAAVHAHQARAAFIPLLAALLARIPTRIYHNRGTPYLGYRGLLRVLLWLLEYLNCRFATHVITVSHSIRTQMIQNGIVAGAKCEVLGAGSACGVDLRDFATDLFDEPGKIRARESLGIDRNAYVALYIGRPFRRKGFHAVLDAWRDVRAAGGRQVLLVTGCTGADVARAGGSSLENVLALGYVKDLRPCYAACDVVVLPSWHEGFPYALLEGAAAARPLIGSNIPGIDSVIVNNRNGLLVPVKDTRALSEALVALRNSPPLRERMGAWGRQYVEQHFDRNAFGDVLLDYYRRIGVNGRRDPAPSLVRTNHRPQLG